MADPANTFNSLWRPFIGWCCAAALLLQFIVAPLGVWALSALGHNVPFTPLDTGGLVTIVVTLLGMGGLRTVEKIQGVS